MNRRQFFQNSAGFVALGAMAVQCTKEESQDINIVTRLIQQNDARIPDLLKRQENDDAHQWHGGLIDGYGIHSAGCTSGFIRDLTCAMLSKQSRYYYSAELYERLDAAARFLLKNQHIWSSQ